MNLYLKSIKKKRPHSLSKIVCDLMHLEGAEVLGEYAEDFQMEIRGIPVTGLKFSGTVGQFVVENDHLGEILDINKSEEGIETDVLGENNVTELDAKKVTAMLKLKMRKNEKR